MNIDKIEELEKRKMDLKKQIQEATDEVNDIDNRIQILHHEDLNKYIGKAWKLYSKLNDHCFHYVFCEDVSVFIDFADDELQLDDRDSNAYIVFKGPAILCRDSKAVQYYKRNAIYCKQNKEIEEITTKVFFDHFNEYIENAKQDLIKTIKL